MFQQYFRRIARLREMAEILSSHGFDFVVETLHLHRFRWGRQTQQPDTADRPRGERLRQVLVDLGPTFIKLGQIVSGRPDLVPPDILRELAQLQDRVPPVPYRAIEQAIEESFGEPVDRRFTMFEKQPLAVASIAQVHRARLHDGTRVVVKVRRPAIEKTVEADLDLLLEMARFANNHLPLADIYDFEAIATEFADTLRSELDFERESHNVHRFSHQFRDNRHIVIPQVIDSHSTDTVLTLEEVVGLKPVSPQSLKEEGIDPSSVARIISQAALEQILEAGFFHADLHPGNIRVIDQETVALLDFGMVGRLTQQMQDQFADLIIALLRADTDGIVDAVLALADQPETIDRKKLWEDTNRLRIRYTERDLANIQLAQAVNDIFGLAFKHRLRIPSDLSMAGRALLTLEGLLANLDPDLNILTLAEPFGRRLLIRRYGPERWFETGKSAAAETASILSLLPSGARRLYDAVRGGELHIRLQHDTAGWTETLDRLTSRIMGPLAALALNQLTLGLFFLSTIDAFPQSLVKPLWAITFLSFTGSLVWIIQSLFRSH